MSEQQKLIAVPVKLKEARRLVTALHRHHKAPQGGLWAVAVSTEEPFQIVGVAIVGRPVARMNTNGWTAEVIRVAVAPDPNDPGKGHPNACSFLYASCWRAAKALGYKKLITYTLNTESGISLKAAGWTCVAESRGGSWNRLARPRIDMHPTQGKLKWEAPE